MGPVTHATKHFQDLGHKTEHAYEKVMPFYETGSVEVFLPFIRVDIVGLETELK